MTKFRTIRHYDVPGHAHELTFSCVDMLPLFSDNDTCEWFVRSLSMASRTHQFHLWAFVLMPNHAHVLILPLEEDYSISHILKSIKQSVARRYMNLLRTTPEEKLTDHQRILVRKGRFWQEGPGFDRNVHGTRTVHAMIAYIHNNPVRKGLVECAEDWEWSSARAWAELGESPIPIDREFVPLRTH